MPENSSQIKLFSYINKNNNIEEIKVNYGQNWSEIKTDNETLNSIFAAISNGKQKVDAKDLNILNRIFLFADSLLTKTKGDEILEQEEIEKLKEKIDNNEIDLMNIPDRYVSNGKVWSEGTDRIVTAIQINKPDTNDDILSPILSELQKIADIEGFEVERTDGHLMLEDSSIRRADGKKYVPYHTNLENQNGEDNISTYTNRRHSIPYLETEPCDQGTVAESSHSFEIKVSKDELYYGTSYLEGGNVLNTVKADGTPAAIIGEESIGYTLNVMGLDSTENNIELAKKQIAQDLGLKPENITYIPQFNFHIDMRYRPLHNGEIAIPDIEQGIEILKQNNIEDYDENHIEFLENIARETKSVRDEAEENLKQAGYNIVKIPYFNTGADSNYMNGVTGTSPKTGKSFYITNKSDSEQLDEIVKEYFQKAGIDHVYFISSKDITSLDDGAIDCMTQEK